MLTPGQKIDAVLEAQAERIRELVTENSNLTRELVALRKRRAKNANVNRP